MSDTSTPSNDGAGEQMRAVVDNYGTLPAGSNAISADLQPYAEQVLKMDPLRDVPGNVHDVGGFRPLKLEITALPPELQSVVHRKIEAMPKMDAADRAKYVDKFVAEVAREQLGRVRGMIGVGPDALPFHKEQAEIAAQVSSLTRQRNDLQAQMDEIARLHKGEDPVTGEVIAVPEYALSELKRAGYTDTIANIDRKIRLLVKPDGKFGIEGKKRMDRALAESAALLKARNAAQSEEAEAKQRAEQMLRDERINRRAEALARMQRGSAR